jgi:Uma2 family endonuclease
MHPTPPEPKRWTAAEVRALIDASPTAWPRYELVDGELLVTPAPAMRHQRIVQALWRLLDAYVRRERVGEVFGVQGDVQLEVEQIVQPDLFVIPWDEARRAREWSDVHALLLAVEVLSPGSERHDRVRKRRYYRRNRVPEYWIADGEARVVERWTPDDTFRPEVLDESLVWHPAGAAEPLVIDLPALFAEADDDEPREPDAR